MRTSARTARWLLLGGWFGSWALFALAVAPLAFRVLPGAEAAGALVGPLLRILHIYGLFAGLGLFAIAFAGKQPRALQIWPLGLALLCAVTEFGVTSAITEIRPSTFDAHTLEGTAERFAQLHLLSRLLFGAIWVGTGVLIALHARHDALEIPRNGAGGHAENGKGTPGRANFP